MLRQFHKGGNVAPSNKFAMVEQQVPLWCIAFVTGLLFFAVRDVRSQALQLPTTFERRSIDSTSSRLVRLDGTRNFPLAKLTPRARKRVDYVLAKPTLFRRIIVEDIECDRDLFVFMVRNPEIVVNIWELMGIMEMQLLRTSPDKIHLDDGQGTVSMIEMLYGTPNVHIAYADGIYQGPLFGRTLKAKCALAMHTWYTRHQDGRPLVSCQLDVFVRVENLGVDLLTRTLRPVAARMADYNFSESTQFISQISQAAVKNGPAVQRLAHRLTDVDPDVQKQFVRLTGAISIGKRTPATETPVGAVGSSVLAGVEKSGISITRREAPLQLRRTRFLQRK